MSRPVAGLVPEISDREEQVTLGRDSEPAQLAQELLPLVYESASAYFDWLFGGPDAAQAQLLRWLGRASSEVAMQRATLLVEDGSLSGAYIALSGRDLVKCRKADTFALFDGLDSHERSALLDRLGAVRSLFAPVASDEWYLSKLAVAPAARRRGVGGRLLSAYLRAGTDAAFTRFRLDVDASNEPAIALYTSHGFRIVHDVSSGTARIRYVAMTFEA